MTTTEHFDIDRAQGVLIGLAAGDKNLGPIEMALMVAESLIAKGAFELSDMTDRWLNWWQQGAWDTGQVFDKVMRMVDSGVEPELAAARADRDLRGMTAGCNGAHRVPVLAASRVIPGFEIDETARQLTAQTHHHVLAQDAAVAVARLCRHLVSGGSIESAIETIGTGLEKTIQESVSNSTRAPGGTGGFSPATLQSALHFVRTRASFETTLSDSLDYAGPANYCPVLAGAIAGARWGASSIDLALLEHCRDRSRILDAAKSLVVAQPCESPDEES